jgi:hypothetical protein
VRRITACFFDNKNSSANVKNQTQYRLPMLPISQFDLAAMKCKTPTPGRRFLI